MITRERRNALLDEAKALVLKGWCQYHQAEAVDGEPVDVTSENAVKFCAAGACVRVTGLHECLGGDAKWDHPVFAAVLRATEHITGAKDVGGYNDHADRTKYEVAAIFDHAKEMPL